MPLRHYNGTDLQEWYRITRMLDPVLFPNQWMWDGFLVKGSLFFMIGVYGLGRLLLKKTVRLPGPLFASTFGLLCVKAALDGGAFHIFRPEGESLRYPRVPFGAYLMQRAGLAMLMVLLFRLCAYKHFGGGALDLDFGMQWDAAKGKRGNKSMEWEFNSFAHAFQGMLSWFLYPSTEWLLLKVCWWLPIVGRATSLILLVYPIYNVKKRVKKHGEYFAFSSFFNNQMEWGVGFLLGLYFGIFTSVENDFAPNELHNKTRVLDIPDHCSFAPEWIDIIWVGLDILRAIGGIVLFGVTIMAAVQLWRTWNSCPPGLIEESSEGSGSDSDADSSATLSEDDDDAAK